jgi:3'-phosphoadenosine 5'-phosphosulfate sulfotransferase (PAPS reductase)/FAD synthetase
MDLFGHRPLTILSDGLGVDTGALKVLLYKDPRMAERYWPDYIVHVNTGAEMPYTHFIVEPAMREWMVGQGYPNDQMLIIQHNDLRYSPPSKLGSLDEWYGRQPKAGIPTRQARSCTDGAKIIKFNKWLNSVMPLGHGRWKQYGQRHRVIIGIAADESHRADEKQQVISKVLPGGPGYIEYVYPLIDLGYTRLDCFEILGKEGLPALKSGCFFCPFQPLAKFWAVRELYPECHRRSVEMERKAMAHNPKLSIIGKSGQSLDEAINDWVAKQTELPDPWATLTGDYQLDRCW